MPPPLTQTYVEKPHKVNALQWHTGDPLPPGVDTCTVFWADGRPHAHTDHGMKELHDTDWVLYAFRTDRLDDLLTNDEFVDRFGTQAP